MLPDSTQHTKDADLPLHAASLLSATILYARYAGTPVSVSYGMESFGGVTASPWLVAICVSGPARLSDFWFLLSSTLGQCCTAQEAISWFIAAR